MQNGGEAFQKMVDVAPDAMQHKINSATAGIDLVHDTHRANQALESILATLAKAPASVASGSAAKALRHDQVLARLARKFQLDMQQIRSRLLELRNATRRQYAPQSMPDAPPAKTINFAKLDRKELELLEIVIEESTLVDSAIENIAPGQFLPGPLRELYEHVVELFHAGEEISFELLMLQIEESHLKNLVVFMSEEAEQKRLAMASQSLEYIDPATQLAAIIEAFNAVAVESGKRATISQLQQKELNEKEEASKLEELFQQMKQRQGL